MNYYFHLAAEAEHLESVAYYESKQAGLGASYLAEFERTMSDACGVPHRYPIEKQPDVRRIRMNRFPFAVLFPGIIRYCSGAGCCSQSSASAILAGKALLTSPSSRRQKAAWLRGGVSIQ